MEDHNQKYNPILVPTPPRRIRIYELLDADPYSCQRRQPFGGKATYVMNLRHIPEDTEAYVTSRLPGLKYQDWWRRPRSDKAGNSWIEITIREEAVRKIIAGLSDQAPRPEPSPSLPP